MTRCPNTIHSDYVTDHRCLRVKGHSGDCLFGDIAGDCLYEDLMAYKRWLTSEIEDLPMNGMLGGVEWRKAVLALLEQEGS